MSSIAVRPPAEPPQPQDPAEGIDPLDLDEDGQPVDDSDSPEPPAAAWARAVPNFLYGDLWERAVAQQVGKLAQARRLELGLTQEDVAARSGFTQSNLARVEQGKHLPTLATLSRLAVALRLAWRVEVAPGGARLVSEPVPG